VSASSRDRITVDMRGMKGALEARARQLDIAPSEFVRTTLADALGLAAASEGAPESRLTPRSDRVRLCLRIRRSEREQLQLAAKEVGLTIAELMLVLMVKPDHRDTISLIKVLSESNAELATLSRALSHLMHLLGQGSVRAALVYRDSLDRADGEVRAHLKLSAEGLSDLQPLIRLARQRGSNQGGSR
jgi:hypothetical protein